MERLKGLYIEDEMDNIEIYTALFELEDLQLVSINPLPQKLEGFYDLVLENEVDFLIIDNHLEKQVTYKGIDVLREIRKNDSTIYAVLLTNYPLENFTDQFGDYDYELQKDKLQERYKDVAEKIKRACALREENDLNCVMSEASAIERDKIELLKKISTQLDEIR